MHIIGGGVTTLPQRSYAGAETSSRILLADTLEELGFKAESRKKPDTEELIGLKRPVDRALLK
jgi:hypothetical protein